MGKKIAIGTIVGFVVLFGLGALTYGVIMKDAMAKMAAAAGTCMHAEPSMMHITLATLAQALLFAWIIYRFGSTTFSSGAMAGGLVSLLISAWYNIWFLASMPWYNSSMAVSDTLVSAISGAIAGGLIAWTYGKVK